jgi:hypothetical protein
VSAGFDWKPLLSEGETVVWEGRPSRLKFFAGSAVLTVVVTATWLMAMREIAQAPGGTECFAADCPTADRKAGFVVYFAGPVSFFYGVFFLLFPVFIRQVCAVTSKRVLSISFKLWRNQPTLKQVPVKGATGSLNAAPLVTLGLIVRSPHTSQSIVLWAKSRAEYKMAESIIEQLSSVASPLQGQTQ